MTVRSSLFPDVSISAQQYAEGGYYIIYHNMLQEAAAKEKIEFKYEGPFMMQTATGLEIVYHCAVKAPGTDNWVTAVGESNPENLTSEIAQKFPAQIAANRAFDRAMIQLLAFNRRVYSSSEIYENPLESEVPAQPVTEERVKDAAEKPKKKTSVKQNADKTAEKAPVESDVTAEPEMDAPQFTTFGSAPKKEEVKAEAPKEVRKDPAVRDEDIILFGSCKGMKYGDAKYTASFASFIKSVKTHVSLRFPDAERTKQLEFFRNLGESYGTNQRS